MSATTGVLWAAGPLCSSATASAALESVPTTTGRGASLSSMLASCSSATLKANSSARVLEQWDPDATRTSSLSEPRVKSGIINPAQGIPSTPNFIRIESDLFLSGASLTVKGKKVKSKVEQYKRLKAKDNTKNAIQFLSLLSSKKTNTKVVKQVWNLQHLFVSLLWKRCMTGSFLQAHYCHRLFNAVFLLF